MINHIKICDELEKSQAYSFHPHPIQLDSSFKSSEAPPNVVTFNFIHPHRSSLWLSCDRLHLFTVQQLYKCLRYKQQKTNNCTACLLISFPVDDLQSKLNDFNSGLKRNVQPELSQKSRPTSTNILQCNIKRACRTEIWSILQLVYVQNG